MNAEDAAGVGGASGRDRAGSSEATMTPMVRSGRTTDPGLLERVRDWSDGEAWARFMAHYQPQLRSVCRGYGLVGDRADDCCQQVWIKLASAMRRFHYDPGLGFRNWLHVYFHCRVKDVLKASRNRPLEVQLIEDAAAGRPSSVPPDDGPDDPVIRAMLRQAREVQDAVRARVTPDNWEVFRLVAIEGRAVAEAAAILGREYMAAYRAYRRVSGMIAEERRRRDGQAWLGPAP
ncbi:MAG: sigma-70 family RNA polymerase sigma factor [Isosphaeraceae bacterium]